MRVTPPLHRSEMAGSPTAHAEPAASEWTGPDKAACNVGREHTSAGAAIVAEELPTGAE